MKNCRVHPTHWLISTQVGVDGDDTRRWSVTRLIQRLDNFRVPAEASILLRVARPVLLDVHAEPRRPSRAEPSPRPSRDDGAEPSRDDGAAVPPSRDEGADPTPRRPSRDDDGAAVSPPPPPPPDDADDGPAAASGPPERPARRRSSAAVSVASEPDAELRRENDELRSEVLRLRESLALADARRATAERELRDAREDAAAAAAPLRSPLAARNAPPPAASADIARRLERFKKRLGAMNAKPVPDRQARVRRESFVAKGDLESRRAAVDLRLRFRPSDEDLRRANICHFHRQWHL